MRLAALQLPGDLTRWMDLGFAPDDSGRIRLANGSIEVGRPTAGLAVDAGGHAADLVGDVEGIPLISGSVVEAKEHPNGAIEFDHVVIMSDSLERTSDAVESALDLRCRRVSETTAVRQAFHRFDDEPESRGCIVEVVESGQVEKTALWGLVVVVADLDAAVAAAPDLIGSPKPAVQPGRRIATVTQAAGLSTAVALMSR